MRNHMCDSYHVRDKPARMPTERIAARVDLAAQLPHKYMSGVHEALDLSLSAHVWHTMCVAVIQVHRIAFCIRRMGLVFAHIAATR